MAAPLVSSDTPYDEHVVAALNRIAPNLTYLGTPWNQNRRRFTFALSQLTTPAGQQVAGAPGPQGGGIAANTIHTFASHTVFTGVPQIAAWMLGSPKVEIVALSVKCMFNVFLNGASVAVYSVTTKQADTAPADQTQVIGHPTNQVDYATPLSAGGVPQTVVHEHQVGNYGVSSLLHPTPVIGGLPRLTVVCEAMVRNAIPASRHCGLVYVDVTLVRS